MFDTIHVKTPLLCPTCGAAHHDFQTKEFGSSMADYRVGSVLNWSPVVTGILKERLWCSTCYEAGRPTDESVLYVVIWHSVLAGVEQDLGKAEARLAAVDRLDLIGWLDEAQREAMQWQRRYHGLFHDVRRWHEHLRRASMPPPENESDGAPERHPALRRLFALPDEILDAPDPLGAFLAKHDRAEAEESQDASRA